MAGRALALHVRVGDVVAHCFAAVFLGKTRLEARGCGLSRLAAAGRLSAGSGSVYFVIDQQSDHRGRDHLFCEPDALHAELVYGIHGLTFLENSQLSVDCHAHGKLQQRPGGFEGRRLLRVFYFLGAFPDFAADGIPAVEIVMAPAWLKARQTKYSAFAFLYIAVVVGVLVFVNVFADRYNKSYDSTANKQFSLSEQTIKIVKGLRADTELTYFGSDFTEARDTLDRYSSLSPKVHAKYIDPERKPQEARAAGFRSDSPVVVDIGSRREGAKSLTEEELTAALIRAEKTGERTVCMLSAAGEHSADDQDARGYSALKAVLERENYKVRTESLTPAAKTTDKTLTLGQQPSAPAVEISKDCTVLVIAGPKSDYPSPVVSAIEKFVEGGGRALVLLDTPLRLGNAEPPTENEEFDKLLAKWGATPDKDLVLDLSGYGQLFNL